MKNMIKGMVLGALVGISGVAHAETASTNTGLQSEVAALKARLVELESKQNDTWLNERRTEEVKNLVQEVLADADTRASLLASGMNAGYDKGFFISSDDGAFLLKINTQTQMRYIFNSRDHRLAAPGAAFDKDEFGFQLRRVKLAFKGHVGSPKITYAIGLQTHRNTENIDLDHAYFGYKLMDNVTIYAGEGKAPFLREETTSSKRQLAVERSLVNEVFTAGRVQGVWTNIEVDDRTKLAIAITDGANSGEAPGPKDFHNDATDFAFTARIDLLLAGEWKQMKDFSAWSGEGQAVFVGLAIHHEVGESGDGQAAAAGFDDFTAWTIDGSIESEGLNVFAAIVGVNTNNIGGATDTDTLGILVQSGFMLIPDKLEPFIRWEHIDPDISHDVNLVTVGANYYLNQHNAKFTTDLVWALNSLANVGGSSGLGLLADTAINRNQLSLRAQFQLVF